uniref:Uncharacterized protein n=1 Tax=Cucumis melo TaxID=3656 RepID=A0A9I9D4N8_CUCME
MNQEVENVGKISEARRIEAQGGIIIRLTQLLDRIEVALRNPRQGEVWNKGVENEEDEDNEILLAGQNPRGKRVLGQGRRRGRREGRGMLPERRVEREYENERREEKWIGGVKLIIPTFDGTTDLEEYL